ncbi:hypothetical protein [Glaciibacter superstes]|uniref:hypothetical protein n=1 Tax=Glaciibacter superstes TaxID=501023 RepID=UPI0012F74D22|nr:hypothetical protein [Glaciibacter superstes]
MDKTPVGKYEIRKISGEAEIIATRGAAIESLGIQMKEAAGVLSLIKDGAETRGKSLESIKDSVGDASTDLKKAGERYQPSGKVLAEYGNVLGDSQTSINLIVPEAERLWAIYDTKAGEYWDAVGVPIPDDQPDAEPVPGELTAEQRQTDIETKRTAKNTAYDNWELEAGKYDTPYESWAAAYESARSGLKEANDDGVEDSFWDNALPAIDVILTILSYAGVILAVAAIIIGGPLIAILAVVVGVIALGLTIWKVAAGRGNGWDIAIAAVGILPFGKIAGAFKGIAKAAPGARLAAAGRGGRDVLTEMSGLTNIRQVRALRGVAADGRTVRVINGSGNLNRNGTAQVRARFAAMGNARNSSTIRERLLIGHESVFARNVADGYNAGSNVARNRVTSLLADSGGGRIVQDIIDNGQSVGNVDVVNIIDSVVKPGGGFARDRIISGWGS